MASDDTPIIGGRGPSRSAGSGTLRAGSDLGFEVALVWAGGESARGDVSIYIAGRQVWGIEGADPTALSELLLQLACAWPMLRSGRHRAKSDPEETSGEKVRSKAAPATGTSSVGPLSRGRGATVAIQITPDSFHLERTGATITVEAAGAKIDWHAGDVLRSLSVLGDGIAARLRREDGGGRVVAVWEGRHDTAAVDIVLARNNQPDPAEDQRLFARVSAGQET